MRTRTLAVPLLASALLLGACGGLDGDGGGGSGGGTAGIDHPTGPDELVLRVETGGGFVPVEYNLANVPGFSLFGDGRVIVTGPMIEIYPGPALPNLQVTRVAEEGIQAILEEARRAGLFGRDATYGFPCVTDLPTTTFTLVAEGATHTVSAYALGFEDSTTGSCPGVETQERARLVELSRKLGDLASWLPEGSVGRTEEYVPQAMRIFVTPYRQDPELEQDPVRWPLEDDLGSFGSPAPDLADYRCGVVDGEELRTLLPVARSANQLTPWASDGDPVGLVFRPLLPDEAGC
jgi:hypothetical protein